MSLTVHPPGAFAVLGEATGQLPARGNRGAVTICRHGPRSPDRSIGQVPRRIDGLHLATNGTRPISCLGESAWIAADEQMSLQNRRSCTSANTAVWCHWLVLKDERFFVTGRGDFYGRRSRSDTASGASVMIVCRPDRKSICGCGSTDVARAAWGSGDQRRVGWGDHVGSPDDEGPLEAVVLV